MTHNTFFKNLSNFAGGLILGLMLLCTASTQAQTPLIAWASGYPNAEPINVGSGKPGYIYFRFEVQNAAIPGAKIVVQLPSEIADSYDPATPATNAGGGAFVDYTGKIAWNATERTITFSNVDLQIGNNVYYKIPHKATDALPSGTTAGNISISVTKDDDTPIDSKSITYNYNRAQLPIVPAAGKSDLSLDFTTNNGSHNPGTNTAQTYKFGLSTTGGSIDSCRVTVSFNKTAATVTPGTWKCKGLPVSRVTENIGVTDVTYTLYLDKTFSQGNDGFDAGEKVDITFDVKKTYCGNINVVLSAAWGSSGDYVASASQTGSFATTPSTGDPSLVRVSCSPVNGGLRNVDGVTPNVFRTTIKNNGTGPACDIVYKLSTVSSPYLSFFSNTDIPTYSIDGGATWQPVDNITFAGSRGSGSGAYLIKSDYRTKPTSMVINIAKNLPAGQNLIIEWKSYTAPDMFSNTAIVDRNWARSVRHDDNWAYTDLCRSSSFTVQSTQTYALADYFNSINLGTAVNLNPVSSSQEAKLLSVYFDCYAHSGLLFTPGATGGYVQMRVFLPDGIKIAESVPGTYGVKFADTNGTSGIWNYANPTKTSVAGGTVYTFDFKQQSRSTKYLFINFESVCPATSGIYNADISFDFLPTGTEGGTGANVRMPKLLQFYCPISLSCSSNGLTYTLDMERQTLGLMDSNGDGFADSPIRRIDSSYSQYNLVDHKQVVVNDTAVLHFKGKVLGSSEKYLYAIMYSENNQSYYGVLNDLVTISGDNTYTLELMNPTVANNIITPVSGGSTYKTNAYVWRIARQGGSNFDNNESVNLDVPFRAMFNSNNYNGLTIKVGSMFYASTSLLSTTTAILNPAAGVRQGDEEYVVGTAYFGGGIGAWTNSPSSLNFTGATEIQANNYYNPSYATYANWSPYEFRSIGNVDTVYVNVPAGYLINDQMSFTISGGGALIATADNLHSTKTRKAFPIIDFYDTDPATMYSSNTAGKIRMVDGSFSITCSPKIKSTPRTPVGTSTLFMSISTDGKTYSQAELPNLNRTSLNYANTSLVYADGPGIYISTSEATTKNLSDKRMSWNFKIDNTQTTPADQVWLYVDGPVENVEFNSIQGTGEGKRWIKLPAAIAANGNIQSNLSFDIIANQGCTNQTVTVYPIYNPTAPANWSPFGAQTDAAFNPNNADFDNYVYREIVLKLAPVTSQIAGNFTSWSASLSDPSNLLSAPYGTDSVEVTLPFTVEVAFDASSSAAPVAQVETALHFPKGLEYVPNSAYMEYNGINTQITDADWITQLSSLTSASSATPTSMTLKLIDIVDQPSILSMFGANATIDGGKKAIMRFQLKPTCDIHMNAEQITAQFSGKRYCDLSANAVGSNIQTYPSPKLTLKNALIPFRSDLVLTPQLDSLICEPGHDMANMVLKFTKRSKLGDDMSPSDSIRVAIPASLDLMGTISYSYPGYAGFGLNIPAATGSIDSLNTSNYVIGNLRYFSWQLPLSYYAQLATRAVSDQVELTFNFTVKAGHLHITQTDSSRIYVSSVSEMAPHITCPKYVAEADSTFNRVILVPSRNALLTSIDVNDISIKDFNPLKFEYDVILPCGVKTASINGSTYSECASVNRFGGEELTKQFRRFELKVVAEDGVHTQTYVVNVRPLMPATILEDLPTKLVGCQGSDFPVHIVMEGDSLSYQWYYEERPISGNDNDTIMAYNLTQNADYGYYRVEVKGACHSFVVSDSARLWVANHLPQQIEIEGISGNTVYTGQEYRVHVGGENGLPDVTNYTWSLDKDATLDFTPIKAERQYSAFVTFNPISGPGLLSVTMEHPCGERVATKEIEVILATGINDVNSRTIQLYPNPFNNELHLSAEQVISSITVTDISGRVIATYTSELELLTTIPTASWASGTYLVSIKTPDGTTTHKVVKK